MLNCFEDFWRSWVPLLAPCSHDPANPSDEMVCRWDLVVEVRQLEVGVGVDETRHDRDRAQVAFGHTITRATPADADYLLAIHQDPTIPDRRRVDRNDPGRTVTNHS